MEEVIYRKRVNIQKIVSREVFSAFRLKIPRHANKNNREILERTNRKNVENRAESTEICGRTSFD